MKLFLAIILCMHRVYGYEDSIQPKELTARGAPKGDVLVQRITTATPYVHQLFWDEDLNDLIYTDVLTDQMFIWNYNTGKKRTFYIKEISGEYFTMNIPLKNNKQQGLLGSDNNFRIITFSSDGKTYNLSEPVLQIEDKDHKVRTGHCDKNGVLFFLTENVNYKEGNFLYKIHNKTLTKVQDFKDDLVNDFVFSFDYTKMYVICHFGTAIGSYDFDIKTGKISNHKIVFDATEHNASEMISIELDNEDRFWVSAGQSILVIDQEGKIRVTETPFAKLTSITFGGDKNKFLFVGSTKIDDDLQAGSVLAISGMKSNGQPDPLMVWKVCLGLLDTMSQRIEAVVKIKKELLCNKVV